MPSTTTPTNPATPVTLPDGIEIFCAGRHTDDAGNVHEFSEADVDGMASSYNPALREAPLCVGHPQDNLPAYGWVSGVARNADGRLTISTRNVEPQFAEMVASQRFPKRSASFYPPHSPNNPTPGKWYLRHVAFLGAQPPAIAGLKDIRFSAGDIDAVCFSEPISTSQQEPDDIMTKEEIEALQAKLKAEEAARAKAEAEAAQAKQASATAEARAASFAEQAKTDRKAGFVSFAESQVRAGRLLPKDQAMAVATLEALADVQPVSFSEGDTTTKVAPVQWLQNLISAAVPVINFGEFAGSHVAVSQIQPGAARGKSDAEIDAAAGAYMRTHKVDYGEALKAVTSTFTSAAAV